MRLAFPSCIFQNFALFVFGNFILSAPLEASFNLDVIQQARASGDSASASQARAIAQAISFSLLQPESRVKLSGVLSPHAEVGYHVFDVNDQVLARYTSSRSCPNTFQSIYARGGIGLPLGFSFEGGLSQTISEEKLTGMYASISAQVFDLSPWVYIDVVPAASVTGTFLYNFSSPDLYAITAQSNLGVYNRITGTQIGYLFQYTYSVMGQLNPVINQDFFRHGVYVQVPIYWGTYFKTQVFLPVLAGTISLGYQF